MIKYATRTHKSQTNLNTLISTTHKEKSCQEPLNAELKALPKEPLIMQKDDFIAKRLEDGFTAAATNHNVLEQPNIAVAHQYAKAAGYSKAAEQ